MACAHALSEGQRERARPKAIDAEGSLPRFLFQERRTGHGGVEHWRVLPPLLIRDSGNKTLARPRSEEIYGTAWFLRQDGTGQDGRIWQVRSSREQERGSTDQMTPLSVAQTVGLGVARERQQIRLAREPGLDDEGGDVEALIGRTTRTPAALASLLDQDAFFVTAVCASLWLVRPVGGVPTAETTVPQPQGKTDFWPPLSLTHLLVMPYALFMQKCVVLCILRKSARCDIPEKSCQSGPSKGLFFLTGCFTRSTSLALPSSSGAEP